VELVFLQFKWLSTSSQKYSAYLIIEICVTHCLCRVFGASKIYATCSRPYKGQNFSLIFSLSLSLSFVHHMVDFGLFNDLFLHFNSLQMFFVLDLDFLRVLGADRTFDINSEDFIQVFRFDCLQKLEIK
jgi:hypothetical protein